MNNKNLYKMIAGIISEDPMIRAKVKSLSSQNPAQFHYPFIKLKKLAEDITHCGSYKISKNYITIDALSDSSSHLECLSIKNAIVASIANLIDIDDYIENIKVIENSIAQLKNRSIWRGRVKLEVIYIIQEMVH